MLPLTQEQLEVCAHAGHEAVRTFCSHNYQHQIGPWSRVPMVLRREIMIDAGSFILGSSPEEVHREFFKRLSADGWSYAPEINRETKKHPRILPWNKLSPQQRAREVVFAGVVRVIAKAFEVDSKRVNLKPGEEPPRVSVLDHLEWMDQ